MTAIPAAQLKRAPRLSPANFVPGQGKLLRLLNRCLLSSAYVLCVAFFLWGVSLRWQRESGFTSFIHFGSKFEDRSLDRLKNIPHPVLANSDGYDGQFYAQLALSPTLSDPQLPLALDCPSYRSRRILFSWTAWILGLGQPAWILQAYALQNVLFWLGGAVLLLYWLPPTRWFHFLQWAAILFSRSWIESVDYAVLDGPALFVMLLGMWLCDRGRPYWGSLVLGVSALGKETNLLGGLAQHPGLRWSARSAKEVAVRLLLLVLPIALWLAAVDFKLGVGRPAGDRNFAAPFGGWLFKVQEQMLNVEGVDRQLRILTALCMISTLVHIVWSAVAWQWSSKWWRIAAPYAVLGMFLGPAVMQGYPGAFARVLLPLLAAYNLSLKPTKLGWLLLVIGNVDVLSGLYCLGLGNFLALFR